MKLTTMAGCCSFRDGDGSCGNDGDGRFRTGGGSCGCGVEEKRDDEKEHLLDHFPLRDDEFDLLMSRCWKGRDKAGLRRRDVEEGGEEEEEESSSSSSSSSCRCERFCSSHSGHDSDRDGGGDILPVDCSALGNDVGVPELSGMLRRSYDEAFVLEMAAGLEFPEGTAAAAAAAAADLINRKARFLEAAVSLLGRRGGRFPVRAVFDACRIVDTVPRGDPEEDRVDEEDEEEEVAGALELASLLHRMILASERLRGGFSAAAGDKSGDRTPPPPASWVRSLASHRAGAAVAFGGGNDTKIRRRRRRRIYRTGNGTLTGEDDAAAAVVGRSEWDDWVSQTAPNLPRIVSALFHRALLGSPPARAPPSRPDPHPGPRLLDDGGDGGDRGRLPLSSPDCYRQLGLMNLGGGPDAPPVWKRLYRSDEDGLSFQALERALTSYGGSTVVLLRTEAGERLGYYTEVPWKSSPNWFDGKSAVPFAAPTPESLLFRLHPTWSVYGKQPGGSTKYWQFLHSPSPSSAPRDGRRGFGGGGGRRGPSGLAVGGVGVDSPRLHLNASLERCTASSVDSVFRCGPLLSADDDVFFDVDVVEVWAAAESVDGMIECVKSGNLAASVREAARRQAAVVDRKQFLEDFQSNSFMPNSLYDHRNQMRGRDSFVADDDEEKGYYIEDKPPSVRELVL